MHLAVTEELVLPSQMKLKLMNKMDQLLKLIESKINYNLNHLF